MRNTLTYRFHTYTVEGIFAGFIALLNDVAQFFFVFHMAGKMYGKINSTENLSNVFVTAFDDLIFIDVICENCFSFPEVFTNKRKSLQYSLLNCESKDEGRLVVAFLAHKEFISTRIESLKLFFGNFKGFLRR